MWIFRDWDSGIYSLCCIIHYIFRLAMTQDNYLHMAPCPNTSGGEHRQWETIVVDKDFRLTKVSPQEAIHVRWISIRIFCELCGALLDTSPYTEVAKYELENRGLTRKQKSHELIPGNHQLV